MFNIRDNIKVALAVLGITPYAFCKKYGYELTNFSAFINGGKNTLGVEKVQSILSILTDLINKMPRFRVTVHFEDGSLCNAEISAPDAENAVNRVIVEPEFATFRGGDIVKTEVEEIKNIISAENYSLQPSKDNGWYVCTDLRRKVVLKFKKGDFVNSQKATILFDNGMFNKSELSAAKQDIENYLKAYHADKI